MHKIDAPHATGAGEFTDGDPAMGIEATELLAKWHNTIQRELIAILTAAGITPSAANDTQVAQAIAALLTAHTGAAIAHGATPLAGATKIVLRDAFKRAKFGAGVAADDAVILQQLRDALNTAVMPNYAARVDFGPGFVAPTGGLIYIGKDNNAKPVSGSIYINGQHVCYQQVNDYASYNATFLVAAGDTITFDGTWSRASFYPVRGV